MSNGAIRLLAVFLGGLLLMLIGFEGNPGSILGCIIDPASMTDKGNNSGPGTGTQGLPTSGTLSAYQIGVYAAYAGFNSDLATAIAIALVESGGAIAAKNTKNANGTIDYGLWQINSSHTQYDPAKLLSDPAYNADAAFFLYRARGNSFLDWTTYTNGAYQAKMREGTTAADQIRSQGI